MESKGFIIQPVAIEKLYLFVGVLSLGERAHTTYTVNDEKMKT